jgi:uncharacterized protein (TIGR02284 family)
MEISEKSTEVLNDLIEINNDRVEGFQKAAADLEGEDPDLLSLFSRLANESREYAAELTYIVQDSGYVPVEGTSTSGALHRAWIDIKTTFTGTDREAILNECERGEDAIKNAYRDAIQPDNEISPGLLDVLQRQQQGVVEGHDLIKALRDGEAASENDDTDSYTPPGAAIPTSPDPFYEQTPAIAAEPSYEGAAGEYNGAEASYVPEPEDIEQEESWEEEQDAGSGGSKLMEFFINELKDLLWAERELVETLPDMADAATSATLKSAFKQHLIETETHVDRLEQIFGILGLEVDSRKCDAMAGILDEGDEIISATEDGTAQRDVGLIFAGQKAEHYEIASYGGMIALAKTLGYYEVAELLVLTLDEEKTADAKLTEIAESQANAEAAIEPADE